MPTKRAPQTAAPAAKPIIGAEPEETATPTATAQPANRKRNDHQRGDRYGWTLIGLFANATRYSREEELGFLADLLQERCDKTDTTFGELAAVHGLRHLGIKFASDVDLLRKHADNISQFLRILLYREKEWLDSFLRQILHSNRHDGMGTPEDLLYFAEQVWGEYREVIDNAREVLEENPEALAAEIRAAAAKLPAVHSEVPR